MSSVLAAMLTLVLLLATLPVATRWVEQGQADVRVHATASQGHSITTAVNSYILNNYQAIVTSTAGGPQTVPIATLIAAGYLPPGLSPVNPYGQTWQISIEQPVPNNLVALVNTTGGRVIGTVDLPLAAAEMGQAGGFQPYATGPYATQAAAGDAIGAYGGWTVANFGLATAPGHLANLLYYQNGSLSSQYLYRVSIPGQPQLNTMSTTLNMGGQGMTNTADVQLVATASTTPGGACGPNGKIAANANGTGQLLNCVGGVWTAGGGHPSALNLVYRNVWSGGGSGTQYYAVPGSYDLCVYSDTGGTQETEGLYVTSTTGEYKTYEIYVNPYGFSWALGVSCYNFT
ncbi:MAG: shufflon system plasmid conjugative transfer pilus tip adhesin PilV [Acidiferrobacteraceae bacterium]